MKAKNHTFRLAIPVTLCVSVRATTEKTAAARLQKMLTVSPLEMGIDLDPTDVGCNETASDPEARIYANPPFDGITVEDVGP